MFEYTKQVLQKYEEIISCSKLCDATQFDFDYKCIQLDLAQALHYELGYGVANNVAKAMLLLDSKDSK